MSVPRLSADMAAPVGEGWAELAAAAAEADDASSDGWGAMMEEAKEEPDSPDGWADLLEGAPELGSDGSEHGDEVAAQGSGEAAAMEAGCPDRGGVEDAIVPLPAPMAPEPPPMRPSSPVDIALRTRTTFEAEGWEADCLAIGRIGCLLGSLPAHATLNGRRLFDDRTGSVVENLVSSACIKSAAVIASDTGVDSGKVQSIRVRAGAVSMHIGRCAVVEMISGFTERVLREGGELVSLSVCFRYDETPLKVRGRAKDDMSSFLTDVEMQHKLVAASAEVTEATSAKLVQLEERGGLLVKLGGKFHHVTFSVPTWISMVDRNTGEVLKHLCDRSALQTRSLEGRFLRAERLSTTDAHAANLRAERTIAFEAPSLAHCHHLCDIHKVSHIAQKVGALVDSDISGLVHMALSLQAGGSMRQFRKVLRKRLSQCVVRLAGSPGPGADAHRRCVLDTFLPVLPKRPGSRMRRATVELLANGDYSVPGVVQHYCRGCCKDASDTRVKFATVLSNALANTAPKVFPRSRWTGADECLRFFGLLASLNGLLKDVYTEWAESLGTKLPATMKLGASVGDAYELEEHADDDGAGAGDHSGYAVGSGEDLVSFARNASPEDYRKLLTGYRQKALCCVSAASFRPRLVITSAVLLLQQELMSQSLLVSGANWEEREERLSALAEAHGCSRQPLWRSLLSSMQLCEGNFLNGLKLLLSDEQRWVMLEPRDHTIANTALAFRLVCIAGASCYEALYVPHGQFPWRAFGLAAGVFDTSLAAELSNAKPCMLDAWTAAFAQAHHGRLDSDLAVADCLATAKLLQADTAEIERKHASIRRRIMAASCHTHSQALESTSSEFALRQVLSERASGEAADPKRQGKRSHAEGAGDGAGPEALPQKRRAVGPYRAFFHREVSGQRGRADLSDLARRYHNLGDEERAELVRIGRQATELCRPGEGAFGPSTRQMDRARAKTHREARRAADRDAALAALLQSFAKGPVDEGQLSLASQGSGMGALKIPAHVGSWEDFMVVAQRDVQRACDHKHAIEAALAEVHLAAREAKMAAEDCQQLSKCAGAVSELGSFRPQPSSSAAFQSWTWVPSSIVERAGRAIALRGELPAGKAFLNAVDRDWTQKHGMVCHDMLPKLGKVPMQRRMCNVSGVCLCSPAGKSTRAMMANLNRALRGYAQSPELKQRLTQSFIGLLLEGRPADAARNAHPKSGAQTAVGQTTPRSQVFLHVAALSWSPFRPTFMPMALACLEGRRARCVASGEWKSQAQALCGLQKDLCWSARVFVLVENAAPVASFLPQEQQYTEQVGEPMPGFFWRGPQDEAAAQRKKWAGDFTEPEPAANGDLGELEDLAQESPGASGDDAADEDPGDYLSSASASELDEDLLTEDDASDEGPAASGGLGHIQPGAAHGLAASFGGLVDTALGATAAAGSMEVGRMGGSQTSPGDAEQVLHYSVPGGELRYYPASQRFAAHCENPLHGVCRREKVATGGLRPAQGRPLGYLVAWLERADYQTHRDHLVCTKFISLAERQAARLKLEEAIGANSELFAMERPRRSGEPAEPEMCP